MMNFKVKSFVVCLLLTLFNETKGQDYVYKCKVLSERNQTLCDAKQQDFNLRLEFQKLSKDLDDSQKVMKLLEIRNTSLDQLPENVFEDLAFESIKIFDAKHFTKIQTNAFSELISTHLTQFTIENPSNLSNSPPDYDLYKALNSLRNLADLQISLKELEFHEIPDNAFDKTQNNLKYLLFKSKPFSESTGYAISRIGSKSFSGLSNLSSISFRHIYIQNISSDAFRLDTSSDEKLTINLEECTLFDEIIENDSFIGANRPVTINLAMNRIEYIREEKFGKFLNENKGNRLLFYGSGLHCEDINPFIWLLKDKDKYRNQILGAVCHSKKPLWDQTFYEYKCSFLRDLNKTLCDGQNDGQPFDIVKEFTRLSNVLAQNEKNMESLEIYNTSLEVLPENVFKDLTFESIMIFGAKNLSLIHRNAFSEELAFNLINTFMIEGPTNLENSPPNHNFFEALNSLKNVDTIQISLKPSSVQQIPSYALNKTMFNLRQLLFNATPISGDSFYTISRIESNSFSGLSKVRFISFRHILIENIVSNAFEIYETSDERLTIDLEDCSLNDHAIIDHSFTGANRSVTINLDQNKFELIREEKFKMFLDENIENSLSFFGNKLNCDSVDSFLWLFYDSKYKNQVTDAYCQDGSPIWDLDISSIPSTVNTISTTIMTDTTETEMTTMEDPGDSSAFDTKPGSFVLIVILCFSVKYFFNKMI